VHELHTSIYLLSLWYFILVRGRDASVLALAFTESRRLLGYITPLGVCDLCDFFDSMFERETALFIRHTWILSGKELEEIGES
jgi:hypothetical protein